MRVYQLWSSEDGAGSDYFCSTIADVKDHLKTMYGVTVIPKFEDNNWQYEYGDSMFVYARIHEIEPNAKGICFALNTHPMR